MTSGDRRTDTEQRPGLAYGSLLAGLIVLAFTAFYYVVLARYGLEIADEGHLLHQIYRTYRGDLPYVDFHTGYTPAVYYLNAIVLSLFGENLMSIRLALAACNTAVVVCLLWLTRVLGAGTGAAIVAAAASVAMVPFFDGQFAPFNIPYPAWYVTLFWLLSTIALVRWWRRPSLFTCLVAGFLAGIVFAFKQNSGLLCFAAGLCAVALLQWRAPSAERRQGGLQGMLVRFEQGAHWLIPTVLTAAFALLFGRGRNAAVLLLPLAVLVVGFALQRRSPVARRVAPGQVTATLAALSTGFAAATVPWLAYFWWHLGTRGLLRAIFYVGTPYEDFYSIPYPDWSSWGQGVIIAVLALVLVSRLLRRRILRPGLIILVTTVGMVASAGWVALHPPPMIQGFLPSVVMRVNDIAFSVALFVLWSATILCLLHTRGAAAAAAAERFEQDAPSEQKERVGLRLIVIVGAIFMHMQIYPRQDFMHLAYSAALVVVLGAWLMDRLAQTLSITLSSSSLGRGGVRALVAAPVVAVTIALLAPALLRIDYLVRSYWQNDRSALVYLDSPRAPVVIEPAAGRLFESLSATLKFLRENTVPDDFIFSFPCLDLMTFLSDRRDPTRHGYYFPGSPGHAVEAEVVDSLEAKPPKYVVTLHDHAFFFVGAPIYYFNLRNYVTQNFTFERRMGMFDVLRQRGTETAAQQGNPAGAPDMARDVSFSGAVALWVGELQHQSDPTARRVREALTRTPLRGITDLTERMSLMKPPEQRMLAELILKSRSTAGAASLAMLLQDPELSEREFRLFVRIVNAVGDLVAIPPLLEAYGASTDERRAWIAPDLYTLASKIWIEKYFYAPDAIRPSPEIVALLPPGRLIEWMENPWAPPALREFAVRMAGYTKSETTIPFLVRAVADPNDSYALRLDAAHSLVEMGLGPEVVSALRPLLRMDDMLASAIVLRVYAQDPQAVREVLVPMLTDSEASVRRRAYWMAAGVLDPELTEVMRAGLSNSDPEIRIASIWALARIGNDNVRADLNRSAKDQHDDVRAFSQRALRRLGSRGSATNPIPKG